MPFWRKRASPHQPQCSLVRQFRPRATNLRVGRKHRRCAAEIEQFYGRLSSDAFATRQSHDSRHDYFCLLESKQAKIVHDNPVHRVTSGTSARAAWIRYMRLQFVEPPCSRIPLPLLQAVSRPSGAFACLGLQFLLENRCVRFQTSDRNQPRAGKGSPSAP